MRRVCFFAALAAQAVASSAEATTLDLTPRPERRPLGVIVREARAIHVLEVVAVGKDGVRFKSLATLTSQPANPPFLFTEPRGSADHDDPFRVGQVVVCFWRGEMALLHVGGRWEYALSPYALGRKEWAYRHMDRGEVIYDGTTEALREHVVAILAGRTTTITARKSLKRGEREPGRLLRIKAGRDIADFALSDESPYFVGWGTGEPDEVKKLAGALGAGALPVRINAATDLGYLGLAAKPALPALRRALRDPKADVALAAAVAVARIDADDKESIETILSLLRSGDEDARTAAASALADLGPRAATALPALLKALKNEEGRVRAAAAAAVGPVAPRSASKECVDALSTLLKNSDGPYSDDAVLASLRCFGRDLWTVMPELRDRVIRGPRFRFVPPIGTDDGVALLARFDPPPIEMLAFVLAAPRAYHGTRMEAVRQLGVLGPRARLALPTLRRIVQEPSRDERHDRDLEKLRVAAIDALLAIDPEDGPALAIPVLLSLVQESHFESKTLLARCDKLVRQQITALVQSLGPYNWRSTLALLRDLIASDGNESPAVGCVRARAFWSWQDDYAGGQEDFSAGGAVFAIQKRVDKSANSIAILCQALRDRSPHIRLAAAMELARADPRHAEAVPALQRLLERYPHFICYAADTLVALGPTAAPLAPLVAPLQRHPDDEVCRAACRVMKRIDPVLAAKSWGVAGVPDALPKDLSPLWDDLAGEDALQADMAVWRLAGAGPRAVALLRERLRPPAAVSTERIARLIADLDSRDFATRQRANAELTEANEQAAPALRQALTAKLPLEQHRRIEALLAEFDPMRTPEQRRRLRSVRLLEEMGSVEARALLKTLSEGDKRFSLTVEAAGALRRMERP